MSRGRRQGGSRAVCWPRGSGGKTRRFFPIIAGLISVSGMSHLLSLLSAFVLAVPSAWEALGLDLHRVSSVLSLCFQMKCHFPERPILAKVDSSHHSISHHLCKKYYYFYLLIYFRLYWVFVGSQAFSLGSRSRGYSPVAVCGLLIAAAPLAVKCRLH